MHIRNQKIFEHIAKGGQNEVYWGVDVLPWLCPEGEADLLVYVHQKSAYLLCKDKEKENQLGILIELFSYLRYAEDNHLIYITKAKKMPLRGFNFYENHIRFEPCTLPSESDLGNGVILRDERDNKYIYNIADRHKKILSEYVDVTFIYEDIEKYLFGQIHPAYGLRMFIEHGYLSDQDFYSNKSLSRSRTSIWVAICIAALSPLITVLIGNTFGKTTLRESQYKGLKELTICHDTVENIVHDTIVEYKEVVKYRKVVRHDTVVQHDTVCPDVNIIDNDNQ